MKIAGQYKVAAPIERVWEALNDPDILRQAIPGAQSVEKIGENKFKAVVKAKIGPISARFNGEVVISESNPPHGYKLTGSGQGGVAGFAKGEAVVTLTEENGKTLLAYEADAAVGGKLAQIGQRLIQGVAAQLAAQFFGSFGRLLGAEGQMDTALIDDTVIISPRLYRVFLYAAGIALALFTLWTLIN